MAVDEFLGIDLSPLTVEPLAFWAATYWILVALLFAAIAALRINHSRRERHLPRPQPPLDLFEIAFLYGGRLGAPHTLNTAWLRLLQNGALRADIPNRRLERVGPPPADVTPLEQAVYDQVPVNGDVDQVRAAAALQAEQLGRRPRALGLVGGAVLPAIVVMVTFPLVVAMWLWFAVLLQEVPPQLRNEDGNAILMMLAVGATVIGSAFLLGFGLSPRTRRGEQMLELLREDYCEAAARDLALSFALTGEEALVRRGRGGLVPLLKPPPPPPNDNSSA
jgi:uncharacterized protein (TIGR04222 family)